MTDLSDLASAIAKMRADGKPMRSQDLWKATEIIDYADRCKDR